MLCRETVVKSAYAQRVSKLLPHVFAVAVVLRAAPASARETVTIGDVVVSATIRAPKASGCPSEKAILDSIRRALATPPNAQAPAAVDLLLDVRSDGSVGTVKTIGRGAEPSHGERTTRAGSCAPIAEALVLIVVQTLDPVTAEVGPGLSEGVGGSSANGAEIEQPSKEPAPQTAPAPTDSVRRPREPRHRPLAQPSSRRLIFGATAGGTFAPGIFPSDAFGAHFGLWAGVARRNGTKAELRGSARVEAWTTVFFPSALDVQQGVVRFRGLREQLAACPTTIGNKSVHVFPCVTFGALWVETYGQGFAVNNSAVSLVSLAGLAAVSRLRLTDEVGMRVSAEGAVNLRGAEWSLVPVGVVHRLPPVTFSLTFSFESIRR